MRQRQGSRFKVSRAQLWRIGGKYDTAITTYNAAHDRKHMPTISEDEEISRDAMPEYAMKSNANSICKRCTICGYLFAP